MAQLISGERTHFDAGRSNTPSHLNVWPKTVCSADRTVPYWQVEIGDRIEDTAARFGDQTKFNKVKQQNIIYIFCPLGAETPNFNGGPPRAAKEVNEKAN